MPSRRWRARLGRGGANPRRDSRALPEAAIGAVSAAAIEQAFHLRRRCDANVADSRERAEGEIPGDSAESPEAESIADGGPPAYGPDPIFSRHGTEDGGSAEDTEGLFLPEEDEE